MAMTKEEMIAAIQDLARESGSNSIPRHKFFKHTRLSERQVSILFGSYNGLVEAAGLNPYRFPSTDQPMYSDEQLLAEIVRVLRLPDSKMTRIYFEQHGSISPSACERRFGGWLNTLRSAQQQLDPIADKVLIERMAEYTTPRLSQIVLTKTDTSNVVDDEEQNPILLSNEHPIEHSIIGSESANIYGDFINFRGLQHAPVNEQGVVFLFGMICRELGYVVEIVKSGFPDCEAKRVIRGKAGKWQRVRIEFEYSSRSFKVHGHDPDLCDVIVCWEHNWPDCPIEVLELRSALASIPNIVK
jgi:hypothetical protein